MSFRTKPFISNPNSANLPDIYNKSILVSEPIPASEQDGTFPYEGQTFSRSTLRRVEIPFKRQVKVPTKTHRIESVTVMKRVPIKRLVEVPTFQEVEEEYTVLTDPILPPNADPRLVAEARAGLSRATLKVPVKKTRKVMKPITVIQEIDDWAEVAVPANAVVECDGYRIDEVEDTKVVEVEEVQQYQLQPVPIGGPVINSAQDVGRLTGSRLYRNVGSEVYDQTHPALRDVDDDDQLDAGHYQQQSAYSAPPVQRQDSQRSMMRTMTGKSTMGGFNNTSNFSGSNTFSASSRFGGGGANNTLSTSAASIARNSRYSNSNSFYRSQPDRDVPQYGQYDRSGYNTNTKELLGAGSYKKLASTGAVLNDRNKSASWGLTVTDTHTAHTDGTGVVVSKVEKGSGGWSAGLCIGDMITHIQHTPVNNTQEYCNMTHGVSQPIMMTFNRDGRKGLNTMVYP